MSEQDYEQLTLFPGDSPASRSALPGSEEARRMTVTSGLKCLELYQNSGPLGSLVRMLLGSSIWRSTRCTLTWKIKDTPSRRLLFRLAPLTRRTGGTDAPLWPTVRAKEAGAYQYSQGRHDKKVLTLTGAARMWPTPTAEPCGMTARTSGRPLEKSTKLGTQVALAEGMIPTPLASDYKNRGCKDRRRNREFQLQTYVGGQLNPTWVEWLMGFPLGWTDLNASETP